MSGPGWYCDGCGAYMMHDGKFSYRVAEQELREENERLRSALRQIQRRYMINEPYPVVPGYAPWLKRLVDDALSAPCPSGSGGSDGRQK